MHGLKDLIVERFGTDGWFFATHRTVPGLTLFAPTLEEVASRLPGALALVLDAQMEDLRKALNWPTRSWHNEPVANSNSSDTELRQLA